MIHYTEIVQASLEKVWEQFIYKIEHPENFVPSVQNVQILSKEDGKVIRTMDVVKDDTVNSLKEIITYSPYEVRFALDNHPVFEGYVDNTAKAINAHETEITFSMNWKNKHTAEHENSMELLKNAVLKTKYFIENETT